MEKVKIKGGRPKKLYPRTIVSEVYLSHQEAEELKLMSKKFGFAYLSQFLRVAAFALAGQKSLGIDEKSAAVSAHLGSIAGDINSLYDLCSRPGMPEAAYTLSYSAKIKILQLYKLIHE
jgi:hypothetical protein